MAVPAVCVEGDGMTQVFDQEARTAALLDQAANLAKVMAVSGEAGIRDLVNMVSDGNRADRPEASILLDDGTGYTLIVGGGLAEAAAMEETAWRQIEQSRRFQRLYGTSHDLGDLRERWGLPRDPDLQQRVREQAERRLEHFRRHQVTDKGGRMVV